MIYRISSITPILCFFFNDTATTEIYTLSLHDALPISAASRDGPRGVRTRGHPGARLAAGLGATGNHVPEEAARGSRLRSEEHTSELQSLAYLVCRLLLEKKKNIED